jgi:hypothetical protein
MEIPGYVVLDELIGPRLFRLYRGRHASDHAPVLLKVPVRVPARPRDLDLFERDHVAAVHASLTGLAGNCPENFRGWWLLLSAEIARAEGRLSAAAASCRDAVAHARETGSLQVEALACEAGAKALAATGVSDAAGALLNDAHRLYATWGALAKVHDLERRHSRWFQRLHPPAAETSEAGVPGPHGDAGASLDMVTVLELAQAVAVEIDVAGLLRKLMTIAMENAGAKRSAFVVEREEGLTIEAEATADPEHVAVGPPVLVEASDRLPRNLVQFVRRTGHDLVLANAAEDERFRDDPYVARTRARSVLCVAVSHQGRLGGVLYLENDLSTGTFTPARRELMLLRNGSDLPVDDGRDPHRAGDVQQGGRDIHGLPRGGLTGRGGQRGRDRQYGQVPRADWRGDPMWRATCTSPTVTTTPFGR